MADKSNSSSDSDRVKRVEQDPKLRKLAREIADNADKKGPGK